jgi:hypothetical protein
LNSQLGFSLLVEIGNPCMPSPLQTGDGLLDVAIVFVKVWVSVCQRFMDDGDLCASYETVKLDFE